MNYEICGNIPIISLIINNNNKRQKIFDTNSNISLFHK